MRVKKMKVLWAITAFLVMGPFCLAQIEPEVTEVVVEPNDPNWTPSDCFVAAWESVTFSSVLYNPEEDSDASGYESQQTLTISCNLYKADLRNLLSDTTFLRPSKVSAVDDQNNVYTEDYPDSFFHVRIDTTPRPSFLADRPAHLSLSFPMDPNAGYPVWFNKVSFSTEGLFAYAIRSAKVPFQASEEWIELLPDYRIMIEEAVLEEGRYSYVIKAKYEGPDSRPSSHVFLRDDEPLPQYIDMGMTFLDANGVDVRSYSGGFSGGSSGGGSGTDYTMSGRSSCDACGGVATIQFQFAVDPYIEEMVYVLYDIPVPTF
ncbi:MAG: hypothetical protein ACYSTT_21510 [Planctomycetota bacterium]|jgi:hypothetical protein